MSTWNWDARMRSNRIVDLRFMKMKRALTAFLVLIVCVACTANDDTNADNKSPVALKESVMSDDKLRVALKKLIPDEPDSIKASPMPGVYEVLYGLDVIYISEDGQFLLSGSLIDVDTGKNLTEDKRAEGRIGLINSIDESKMIVFSPEEVKHRVTVFTDIDCGYCRRMHTEIDELNKRGIEVRYLFFPRAGLNSKSYKKAVSVWCAENQQEALTQAKLGKPVAEKTCDNPIDEHMVLVSKLGLTGTPASVLANGQIMPGYLPVERYVEMLAEAEAL